MGRLNSFLQIEDMPEHYQRLSLIFTVISLSQLLTFVIVETFLVLYLLEFLSFAELGIVISIQLLVGGLLDYPTGAFADKFGHGRILITAYLFIIPGGLILYFIQSFNGVVLAFVFISIGRSQESGAMDSYYDNRYRLESHKFDDNNRIFGAFKSRVITLQHFIAGVSFIIGGLISTLLNRQFLILINIIFAIQTLLLVLKLIGFAKPISHEDELNVIAHVSAGIKFAFSKKSIFFFYFGISIVFASNSAIWYSQLLFPYYNAYSGTDFLTGVIRSVNFILGLSLILLVPRMSKKIQNERLWFLVSLAYANPIFFLVTYLYYVIVPPTQSFVLFPFIGVISIFLLVGFGDILSYVLLNRIQLEIVPNNIRNSIYSLIPTIVTLTGVPLAILGGWVVTNMGFADGILLSLIISSLGILVASYGANNLHEGKYGIKKETI